MTTFATEITRCCDEHSDWVVLGEHLIADFPGVPAGDVLAELVRAREAAAYVGLLAAEQLEVAELMVRHEMLVRLGQITAMVRLDPETHARHVDTSSAPAVIAPR